MTITSKKNSKVDNQLQLLLRYIDQAYPSKRDMKIALTSGRKLKIYLGIDPTGSRLHLGHSVPLLVLRQLQKLGHQAILLVGDFTAQIGDPSGKTIERVPMGIFQVRRNMKTYKRQASKLLNFSGPNPVKLVFNSKWLGKMSLKQFIEVLQNFTISQLLERDLFQQRLKEKKAIAMNEFIYPILQGYDSVALDIDGEVGGSDQIFNMLVGRQLMKSLKNRSKLVIAVKLLGNPATGKKMSKSEGTAVWIDEKAEEMFGHIMSLPDSMIKPCLELCTELDKGAIEEIIRLPYRQAKQRLAFEIVSLYHGQAKAKKAQVSFESVFVKREAPSRIRTVSISQEASSLVDVLVGSGLVPSKSEARRLISQGAVEVDSRVWKDWRMPLKISKPVFIKVGKHRFLKLIK